MNKEIARRRLQQYLAAEEAILNGAQSYQIGDRTLYRADLKAIQSQIDLLIAELSDNAGAGSRKVVVFV